MDACTKSSAISWGRVSERRNERAQSLKLAVGTGLVCLLQGPNSELGSTSHHGSLVHRLFSFPTTNTTHGSHIRSRDATLPRCSARELDQRTTSTLIATTDHQPKKTQQKQKRTLRLPRLVFAPTLWRTTTLLNRPAVGHSLKAGATARPRDCWARVTCSRSMRKRCPSTTRTGV